MRYKFVFLIFRQTVLIFILVMPVVYAQDNGQEFVDNDRTATLDNHGKQVRVAHGVIMAMVFLCLKPAGAILL